MTTLPITPALTEVLASLSSRELAFLAGYAWARSEQSDLSEVFQEAPSANLEKSARKQAVLVLSASQTGNAKSVAQNLYQALIAEKLDVSLASVGDYQAKKLGDEEVVFLVSSTQGEGEPPEEAIGFYKTLFGKKAPKLNGVQFAVLGLGDRSYPNFNQAAKDFDAQFEILGGKRLFARVDCDLDYAADSAQWIKEATRKATELSSSLVENSATTVINATENASNYTKENPFTASLLTRQKITARDAIKDVEHIEIDLQGSGISYSPGDALGVWYKNPPALVEEILSLNHLSGEEVIELVNTKVSIREALTSKLDITTSTPSLAERYAELTESQILKSTLTEGDVKAAFLSVNPPISLFKNYPVQLKAQVLADLFRSLTPRLYSIASSQEEVGEEVHLTVGVLRYDVDGNTYTGAASGFLGENLAEDGEVKVFIEANPRFHLPPSDKSILMIGAGTGIAPFRAFMQQRQADGATGKNWLIFGNTKFTDDFLYQAEWLQWRDNGLLTRADLAWSRDSDKKVYVQHKLLEASDDVWAFLQSEATIYVCGDALKMAKDVQQAILQIAQIHGGLDAEAAEEWLDKLRENGRYLRDVY